MTTATTTPTARPESPSAGGLTSLLTAVVVLIPLAMAAPVIDALRSGVLVLGDGPVADAIPAAFYGSAVLPEVLVHNTGWIVALGTVLMFGATYLLHRIEKR